MHDAPYQEWEERFLFYFTERRIHQAQCSSQAWWKTSVMMMPLPFCHSFEEQRIRFAKKSKKKKLMKKMVHGKNAQVRIEMKNKRHSEEITLQ